MVTVVTMSKHLENQGFGGCFDWTTATFFFPDHMFQCQGCGGPSPQSHYFRMPDPASRKEHWRNPRCRSWL
jgi:hypothetical protein